MLIISNIAIEKTVYIRIFILSRISMFILNNAFWYKFIYKFLISKHSLELVTSDYPDTH